MTVSAEALSQLAKPVREAIKERGFSNLTNPQAEAIPRILRGENVLLISPTGTGKTEAAIFPILSRLVETPERPSGIKIVYITPLRALNRDMLERLTWWCNRFDLKLAVRHGDTETPERTRQARNPPDMLITTPETLQAILVGRIMARHLSSVDYVVIDEVHELAEDKRGSQLSLALERLRWVTKRDFQLIGLSATIGSPEKVGQFLVGVDRQISIVKVPTARYMKFEVIFPTPTPEDYTLASKLYTHPEVAARLRIMRNLIQKHKSVLLFTNTRSVAEILASRFKVWDMNFPVGIHHSSLAKPARVTAEQGLKSGALKGVVCTSSLELGIDVGSVDLCIQYMSPRQVTRLLQRVGRSGHSVGRIAKGIIISMDSDDTLESLVIVRRALQEEMEPVNIHEKPYDALNHQIMGLLIQSRKWYIPQILELFRKAYPYRSLTEDELEKTLQYGNSRFPRLCWVSTEDKVVMKPKKTKSMYSYYFNNLSMIPDETQYLVIDETTDAPVGVLDEAFVAEYGEPGTKFIFRGSPWRIINVFKDKINVKPIEDPTGAIPSWVGDEIPVPYEVAIEVGEIRGFVEDNMINAKDPRSIAEELTKKYPADQDTILRAITEIVKQKVLKYFIPTDKRVTVEEWEDYIIIQCCFGLLVNKTLSRLIGHVLTEKKGYTMGVQQDPYRIVIQTQGAANSEDAIEVLRELSKMNIDDVMIAALLKTSLFKRRLMHVARKFGAISKTADFGGLTLQQLMKSFAGSVILDEAIKFTLEEDFDVEKTKSVLGQIQCGDIKVAKIMSTQGEPTPLAKVGMEQISWKTDLIPPEKMRRLLIDSAKARLLTEVRTFVCIDCWEFVQMIRMSDLPDHLVCPRCESKNIGVLDRTEEDVLKICNKVGRKMSTHEKKIEERAIESSLLMSDYGKVAAIVLSGKGIEPKSAKLLLVEESEINDHLFDLIVDAERKALIKGFL